MKLPQEVFYTSRIHLNSAEPCLLLFHNVLNIYREKEHRHCDTESCFPFYLCVANCFLAFFVLSSHFPLLSHFVRLTFQRSFTQLTLPLNIVPTNIFEEQPHLQSRSKWSASCSAFAKHIKSFDSN